MFLYKTQNIFILRYYTSGVSSGRKSKSFNDSSERNKRRKTEILRSLHSGTELSVASSMVLRTESNKAGAKLINEIASNLSEHAANILKT